MNWRSETVVLTHPIDAEDKSYGAITLREPNVDALEAIEELGPFEDRLTVKQTRAMIALLGDLPNDVVGKLHRADFERIGEALGPLLEASPEAGEANSTASSPASATS